MTNERWQRIKAVFEATVGQPPSERTAFLAAAAGDDEALRAEVESLLAADSADGVLDRLTGVAGSVQATPSVQHIGQYEVVALIGAGSMGEVYRARDTKLNRDVAVK